MGSGVTAAPGWKCRRCNQMQTNHKEPEPGVFFCKDGKEATRFKRMVVDPTRRPMSVSAEELNLLHTILTGVQTGRDLRVVVRHRLFRRLAGTVTRMRKKSADARAAINKGKP